MNTSDPINQYQPNSIDDQSPLSDLTAKEEKQLHLLFQHTLQETMRNAPKVMFTLGSFLVLSAGAFIAYSNISKPTSTTSQASFGKNVNPIIYQVNLPNGVIKTEYSGTITAIDPNKDNTLSLTIENLPPGLILNSCQQEKPEVRNNSNKIICTITGIPTTQGKYTTRVVVTDNQKGKTEGNPVISIN